MTPRANLVANISLSFLWFFTGITSVFFANDIGYDVLAKGGITGNLATLSIYLGSALDVCIGIWLLTRKNLKLCYWVQIAAIVLYTILLTIIEPTFWLHPFGPLTKNVPILALIYYLYCRECLNSM